MTDYQVITLDTSDPDEVEQYPKLTLYPEGFAAGYTRIYEVVYFRLHY